MSPPTPQLFGWVTASTALVATAASAAVPPAFEHLDAGQRGRADGRRPPCPRGRGRAERCEYPIWGTRQASCEEPGDLVLGEDGQRPLARAVDERHALVARHDLADEVAVDRLAGERVDDDAGLGRRQRHEQRAGGDGAERIEAERLAQRAALGQHHDAVAVDAQPHAGRRRPARAARWRCRPRSDRASRARWPARTRSRPPGSTLMPGVRRKPLARADHRGRHAARAQLGLLLPRDDGRALQRHALGHARSRRRPGRRRSSRACPWRPRPAWCRPRSAGRGRG